MIISEKQSLPAIGKPTDEESKLIEHMGNCISDYLEINPSDRREMLCYLSWLSKILFTIQTPLNVEEQCNEIEMFCCYLKQCAKGNMS